MRPLTPLGQNCSALNLARHGHRKHAPLTAPPTSPLGQSERALLDKMEENGCWPWQVGDLAKLFPAPNESWREHHGDRADVAHVLHMLRALQVVGEVAYDKQTRRWRRTP